MTNRTPISGVQSGRGCCSIPLIAGANYCCFFLHFIQMLQVSTHTIIARFKTIERSCVSFFRFEFVFLPFNSVIGSREPRVRLVFRAIIIVTSCPHNLGENGLLWEVCRKCSIPGFKLKIILLDKLVSKTATLFKSDSSQFRSAFINVIIPFIAMLWKSSSMNNCQLGR